MVTTVSREQKDQIESVTTVTSDDDNALSFTVLWEEAKAWQLSFSFSQLGSAIILGLAPSAWDVGSDHRFAKKLQQEDDDWSRIIAPTLCYLFISLPGLVMAVTFPQKMMTRLGHRCCPAGSRADYKLIFNILSGILVVGAIAGVGIVIKQDMNARKNDIQVVPLLYYFSILTSTCILGVKILAVFLHGPEMAKLAIKTSQIEGEFESSFQALLITAIWLITGKWDPAMLSSVVMIGKTGAENLLSFGQTNQMLAWDRQTNQMESVGLGQKLYLLAKFTPVITFTAVFRLGTLACVWASSYNGLIIILPMATVVPFLILLLAKCCCMSDLSVSDLVRGVTAEVSTLTLWGARGREGSRKIQLWVGLYLFLLYATVLSWIIYDQNQISSLFNNVYNNFFYRDVRYPVLLNQCAITSLCCGLVSFTLFLYQVFCMDKNNLFYKLKTIGMSSIY
eukprot:GFUD01002344.1.p1 GENE.GFUD01002344.1~~GFUD01002344.1.p1  ORF type:complete len:451 (-),score=84.54 GFUD01002344.1:67-1419(-)